MTARLLIARANSDNTAVRGCKEVPKRRRPYRLVGHFGRHRFLRVAGFSVAQAADWPGFRGPAADGIAEQERAPTHFDQTSNEVWKVEIPAGHSSPVGWKGQLFLTGSEGNTLNTLCLDGGSGKKLWEQDTVVKAGDSFEVLARNELGEPILASPALGDNTLVLRSSRHLWAFAGKSQ